MLAIKSKIRHFLPTAFFFLCSISAAVIVQAEQLTTTASLHVDNNYTRLSGQTINAAQSEIHYADVRPSLVLGFQSKFTDLNLSYNYSLKHRFDNNDDKASQSLAATANRKFLQKKIMLNASATIHQALEDPLGIVSSDNQSLFSNTREVWSGSTGIQIDQKLASLARLNASYIYNKTLNRYSAVSDTEAHQASIAMTNVARRSHFPWALNYKRSESLYSNSLIHPVAETASGSLTYVLGRKFRFTMQGGYERYLASGDFNASKPQGKHWNASVSWYPTVRSDLTLGYGKHFFGKNYFGTLNHRTRKTIWSATYSESVTSRSVLQNNNAIGLFIGNKTDENGNIGRYSHFATDDAFMPTDSVFIQKSGQANSTINFKKFSAGTGVYYQRRQDLSDIEIHIYDQDVLVAAGKTPTKQISSSYGGYIQNTFKLGSKSNFTVSYNKNKANNPSYNRYDWTSVLSGTLAKEFGKRVSVNGNGSYLSRVSNNSSANLKEYRASIGLNISL